MPDPKTANFQKTTQRICGTCNYLMSMGSAKCACQHPANFPMTHEIPPVSIFDSCEDHRFKGEA